MASHYARNVTRKCPATAGMHNRISKQRLRQELFAREYVVDLNGTRAAIAAGYSPATASEQASRLLRKSSVISAVDKLTSSRASKLEVKAYQVAEELGKLGFVNMYDFLRIDDDGKPVIDMSKLTRDQAAAICEIREDTTGGTGDGERKQVVRTTFKLHDKKGSLELLGRHLGMFQDNLKVTGLETLAAILAEQEK
eukprot:GHVR01154356.1.p1 GENE.GHVR01154356.1~~GHVR01154356.1.p1  ORF type:complete len:196 (-),score=20.20 GHVR01154356.1:340-927(-)